jgi:Pro-kumamolisin, activation domain/Bacterial Ig-like domain (group 3)
MCLRATRLVACALVSFTAFTIQPLPAQESTTRSMIVQSVVERQVAVLKGNTHPLARAEFDRGAAPGNLPLQRMLLVLKRSAEQESALRKLLDDQQDKNSPNYHKWLRPEEFGRKFGPPDQDIEIVTGWLQSHGFQVAQVAKGRTVVEFSGSAAQVQEAFHTPIKKFVVNGEEHWANAADPQIPMALAPVVAGVNTLHNFYKKPMHKFAGKRIPLPTPGAPHINFLDGSHALVPGDYAVIYNINPTYGQGIRGDGATIAVVGRSNFEMGDVDDFRSNFVPQGNLPIVTFNGPDPGIFSVDEQAEATLDVSWSGGIAPNATINFVLSASTNTTDGVDLSELYIIDNNLADVMTESFGACEAAFTSAQATAISQLAEQAAAQGITYMVSTGDTGSAGCDNLAETRATGPLSVNMLASSPFDVAVGGTMFNEHGQNSTYWNSTNDGLDAHSAKSYIPESVWSETCTTACPGFPPPLAAGGGGASSFFAKPSWQAGVTGIPSDGKRDLPDVSLTAAAHDGYLLCLLRSCFGGGAFVVLGTSASAPAFAGVMALVDQAMGGQGPPQRQGQANYVLYRLAAAETLSQCNGSKTTGAPASTCVFNDVTAGNNAVPGEAGFGTSSAKYQSGTGYDLGTGLGSVNVTNLVNQWDTVTFRPTATTLDLTPKTNITHGNSVTVTASVAPTSGSTIPAPTGDVALIAGTGASLSGQTLVDTFPLTSGSIALPTHLLPGGASYTVKAHYAGDGTFGASDSAAVTVTVTPEPSTTTASALAFDLNGKSLPISNVPYGNFVYFRADVSGNSGFGTPTGDVQFADGINILPGSLPLNSEGNTSTPQGVFRLTPGQHPIVANYGGDSSFNGSSSAAVNVTIAKGGTTTSLSPSAATIGQGSSATLTAIIDTTSFGEYPAGTLSFSSGTTSLGTAAVFASGLNPKTGADQGGTSFDMSVLPLGTNSITAQYSGDSNYAASTSAPVTVNVQPDFDFTSDNLTMDISSPGASGTVRLTVAGHTSYNGTVSLTSGSCVGLPRESNCSFNPASITGSGSTTLTISTKAPTSAALFTGFQGSNRLAWLATGIGTVAGVFLFGVPRRKRWIAAGCMLTLAFLATIVGCGGSGSSDGGGGDPGTLRGSYTVVVSASSGGLTHVVQLTVNVK